MLKKFLRFCFIIQELSMSFVHNSSIYHDFLQNYKITKDYRLVSTKFSNSMINGNLYNSLILVKVRLE